MIHTAEQNRLFHALLKQSDYDSDMKKGLVLEVSGGKYDSSKHLSVIEMAKAIKTLKTTVDNAMKAKQKNCLIVARELGLLSGMAENTNYEKLNTWIFNKFKIKQFNFVKDHQIDDVYRALQGWKRKKNSSNTNNDIETKIYGTLEDIETFVEEIQKY